MAQVLLFHSAYGITPGFLQFAEELRAHGHAVHTADLYDGKTFTDLDEGVRHAGKEVGFPTILERGRRAAESLPSELVYAGFSLGVMPAQQLAQTRPGAKGALFFHGCLPPEEFGGSWPQGLPLQIHMMEADPWGEEDLPVARQLADGTKGIELFVYPGNRHLFADSSRPDFEPEASALLMKRTLGFLSRV